MMHISLFSGIGGFDLASEWMGWKNIASCEINEFGRKVLEYYWPDAYHHDDIHTFTYERLNDELTRRYGTDWRTDDIILTGGFPCQPYSAAGKRLGKEDDRHLWPEMLRVIREVRPKWVVGENVLGIVNWNGGLVFDEVQADLEAEGYQVQPYVLPAAGIGAPHRRDRVWFVAYSVGARAGSGRRSAGDKGRRADEDRGEGIRQEHGEISPSGADANSTSGSSPDTRIKRQQGQREQPVGSNKVEPEWNVSKQETPQDPVRGGRILRESVEEGAEVRQFGDVGPGSVIGVHQQQDAGATPDTRIVGRNDGGDNREERHVQADIGASSQSKPERDGRKRRFGKARSVNAGATTNTDITRAL